ncbi:MAG: hypothetical protein AB1673_16455 [Actinomycetota bacterium]
MDEIKVPVTVVLAGGERPMAEVIGLLGRLEPGLVAALPRGWARPAGTAAIEVSQAVGPRTPGCPCCAVRVDVRTVVGRLLARRHPPPAVVVGAGPADAAPPLLSPLLCDPWLTRRSALGPVVAALDGPEAAVRLRTGGEAVSGAIAAEHVALADVLAVTRAAELTAGALAEVRAALAERNPFSPVWLAGQEALPAWPASGDAWALTAVAARLDSIEVPPGSTPWTALFDIEGQAPPEALRAWVSSAVRETAGALTRLQAVVPLTGGTSRWVCSAVGSYYCSGLGPPAPPGAPPRARVLMAGHRLERSAALEQLRDVLATQA